MQSIGQAGCQNRSEKIDVGLQVRLRVMSKHGQRAAMMIACADQVKVQAPCAFRPRRGVASRFSPSHSRERRRLSYGQFSVARVSFRSQLESIEIIFFECRAQDSIYVLK